MAAKLYLGDAIGKINCGEVVKAKPVGNKFIYNVEWIVQS